MGGKEATPHSWPYQVLIVKEIKYFKKPDSNVTQSLKFFCGGTIINKYSILTAAHCVYDNLKDNRSIANFLKESNYNINFRVFLGYDNIDILFNKTLNYSSLSMILGMEVEKIIIVS